MRPHAPATTTRFAVLTLAAVAGMALLAASLPTPRPLADGMAPAADGSVQHAARLVSSAASLR
jgi:hypothetical protein